MDERLKLLSYSSLLTKHSCPRKFQLHRLNATQVVQEEDTSPLTFAYGHLVGEGIQMALEDKSEDEIIWALFQKWEVDLEDRNDKQRKSFYLGLAAIQKFIHLRKVGFLDDYELVHYNDKPAVELSFRITLPDGFSMRGYVDAVLRSKTTGKIIVLECKTSSSSTINAAMYKNSSQGIGYSVVLDVIFKELSSYDVLYLVYKTKDFEYEPLQFAKSYTQRAQWIQELLIDVDEIKRYEELGVYPMRGESCYSFFRECEYYGMCHMSNRALVKPVDHIDIVKQVKAEKEKTYTIELTLDDLINAQFERTT